MHEWAERLTPCLVGFAAMTAILVGSVAPAHAFRPRVFVGPLWFPYPYPYYPPPVVVELAPQAYVQPQPAPPAQGYWYYPYVSRPDAPAVS